jgi:hypothetical protein
MKRTIQFSKHWFVVAASSALILAGVAGCDRSADLSFCEAVASGASNEQLTLILSENGELLRDGSASIIEDPPNDASPCDYEVRGGRVVEAHLIK